MFGSVVRSAREARNLSQTQLAEISGIAQANISAIERDRREPSALTLFRLLECCGFELVARGATEMVRFPYGDQPDEDAVVSSPRPVPRNSRERNEMMIAVLEASEATLRAKARQ